ncbi:MAG TPA: gas vesicle protein [Nocardioidaceae bacterium]|nr:gas vesicle protein [Nocardioidaceae bacterium]
MASRDRRDSDGARDHEEQGRPREDGERRPRKKSGASAPQVASRAASELLELTGNDVEGVVGLERVEHDGWKVQVEVLELRRIPDTTDVLSLYEVDADDDGSLMGYRRLRRYTRGSAGDGGRSR